MIWLRLIPITYRFICMFEYETSPTTIETDTPTAEPFMTMLHKH